MASEEQPRHRQDGPTETPHLTSKEDHSKSSEDLPDEEEVNGDDASKDVEEKASSHSGIVEGAEKEENRHPEDGPVERSRAKIAVIMTALGLATFLAALDITIITTALPTISERFHTSSGYTWIGSGYLLACAASVPLWGKFSDIFGRKPIILVANLVFMVGSLIAALSINIGMLITARAIQGIGGGGLIVLSQITISDLFSPRRRGAYFGIIGGVWALASSLGPILGGAFTEFVSWRWCFYINLPLDGIAFFITLFFLDVKTPKTPLIAGIKAIDWLGALLIVGGVLMFLFGLEFGGETHPWNSAIVICLLVFGVFTMFLFALSQIYVAKYPIMPPRIFSRRSNIASLGAVFIQSFVFISASYYLPLYFQAARGASPILSGVYLLPTSVSLSITSMFVGIAIRKTGKYWIFIFSGMFLMTLGYGLFIDLDRYSSWAKIIIYQIIGGIGVGPNFQAPLIALQSLIQPKDIAAGTATFGFTRQLATSISVVVGGVIFQNELAKKAAGSPEVSGGGGGGSGASIEIIDSLPPAEKQQAQVAFADSLMPIWILYVVVAFLGVLNCFLIGTQTLSKEHKETETGLEAQEKGRKEALAEEEERKANKAARKSADVRGDTKGDDDV